ncbi:dTDP-4-amino-4,6-dideoxygalactose transaminase [Paenibacillus sedimenti]|uniref:dTDP-4-amino-4,6-dideoxygalactose transaminase n=1 Tax=Paenibacillus sedimenti TaxID=2770274 RepID=A0A926KKY5_9BACL|nr:dTDP-4-amino-4,6-dideoxygalactose transaminase [Paenibacillus sedimenti]MBD0379699.1 dTDP-4-amino-4,6-dideoxygalactose transaminase [Paenibacillus sedimenti]
MLPFNIPGLTGNEEAYIREAFKNQKLSGDGLFTKKCHGWFETNFNVKKSLLTTSCTHALEMSAILANIKEGDEVIMPSFTFVSTANAFVLRGAKIVFVDIRPDTMNINENLIEEAITRKTKAIVPVHYAGVACEMDKIMEIARRYDLLVIEDAAQGVMSTYNGNALGSIGHLGCYSFHETKNYNCGEGGALLINDDRFVERAEIIREKGTNRSRFFRGQVDKYTWVDLGSSYLPSEINAAFLYAQLEMASDINNNRLLSWNRYFEGLRPLHDGGLIELPHIPQNCEHNAHMFYIKVRDLEERTELIEYLKQNRILSVFHYIPLHSSDAGLKFGRFHGADLFTTQESERLVRLPMYYNISKEDITKVIENINSFYGVGQRYSNKIYTN